MPPLMGLDGFQAQAVECTMRPICPIGDRQIGLELDGGRNPKYLASDGISKPSSRLDRLGGEEALRYKTGR